MITGRKQGNHQVIRSKGHKVKKTFEVNTLKDSNVCLQDS